MTDQEYADLAAEIQLLVEKWAGRLGLGGWALSCVVKRDSHPESDATCEFSWPYKSADLTFYAHNVARSSDGPEELVVHELLHAVMSPIDIAGGPFSDERVEHVITTLTRALVYERLEVMGDGGSSDDDKG